MPCFNPLQAYRFKYKSGKFSAPFFAIPPDFNHVAGTLERLALPCGQCIGCRLERSREWAVRCVYEASLYKDNCFITLTYAPEHLPKDMSLKKKDWQDFMKRLRKHYSGKKIRFFACGEYGERTFRPHYHAILFNHDFDDVAEVTKMTEYGLSKYKHSPTLEKVWGKGLCSVGEMTFESAAYCARYCLKKINGADAEWHYFGREPEFALMSRMPGLAANWWSKFKSDVVSMDCTFSRGVKAPVPRYFDKLLEKVDKALFEVVKSNRLGKCSEQYDFAFDSWKRLKSREEVKKYNQNRCARGL